MRQNPLIAFFIFSSLAFVVTACTSATHSSEGILLILQEGQIWQFDVASNQIEQITVDEGRTSRIFNPEWSPDGKVFSYERYGNLWVSDRNSETHHEIVSNVNGSWWINPSTLRYCQHKESGASCFLYDVDSDTSQALREGDKWWIGAYSPDVTKVFVQKRKPDIEKIQPETKLYLLDIETGQPIFEYETGEGFWTEDPQWTSNGEKVAFTASLSNNAASGEIFVLDANGENLTQLTHFSEVGETSVFPALLQWSPNSEWLAFVIAKIGTNELAIMKSDGSALKRLNVEWVTLGQSNLHPVWSPDSKTIAFVSNQINQDANEWSIYTINIDTGNILQIVEVSSGPRTWLDWK